MESKFLLFSCGPINGASLILTNLTSIKLENFVVSVELFGTKTEE